MICEGKPWGNHQVVKVHYFLRKGEDKRREVGHNLKGTKEENPMKKATLSVGIV